MGKPKKATTIERVKTITVKRLEYDDVAVINLVDFDETLHEVIEESKVPANKKPADTKADTPADETPDADAETDAEGDDEADEDADAETGDEGGTTWFGGKKKDKTPPADDDDAGLK